MFGLSYLKIGAGIALLLFAAWAFRVNSLRGEYKEQRDTITAAVGKATGISNLRPDRAVAAVEQLAANLATCRANNATLTAGIETQNRAVETQRRAGESRIANLEQSLTTARTAAQTAQSRAAAILARRPGADQCADALGLIRGN